MGLCLTWLTTPYTGLFLATRLDSLLSMYFVQAQFSQGKMQCNRTPKILCKLIRAFFCCLNSIFSVLSIGSSLNFKTLNIYYRKLKKAGL